MYSRCHDPTHLELRLLSSILEKQGKISVVNGKGTRKGKKTFLKNVVVYAFQLAHNRVGTAPKFGQFVVLFSRIVPQAGPNVDTHEVDNDTHSII